MKNTDEEKTAFNARAKASMREYLRGKTWKEKVESIARMNAAGKVAREAMRRAMLREGTADAREPSERDGCEEV